MSPALLETIQEVKEGFSYHFLLLLHFNIKITPRYGKTPQKNNGKAWKYFVEIIDVVIQRIVHFEWINDVL